MAQLWRVNDITCANLPRSQNWLLPPLLCRVVVFLIGPIETVVSLVIDVPAFLLSKAVYSVNLVNIVPNGLSPGLHFIAQLSRQKAHLLTSHFDHRAKCHDSTVAQQRIIASAGLSNGRGEG